MTVMTHVKALQAGHSSQGTSEPITPAPNIYNASARSLQKKYTYGGNIRGGGGYSSWEMTGEGDVAQHNCLENFPGGGGGGSLNQL